MYYFINFDNPSKSENYDKGLLFERLCKDLINYNGYNKIEMRQKNNNLEFDVSAKQKLTGKELIGEAKALSKKISDQIMVFFAKMMIYWKKDKDTLGIFISVSELTPDTKGFIKEVSEEYKFIYITGEQILENLVEHGNYISAKHVRKLAEEKTSKKMGDTHFLVTDRGDYYIQLLISKNETLPSSFIVYDTSGNQIADNEFLDTIKRKIDILKEIELHKQDSLQLNNNQEMALSSNSTFLGVASGQGWFDYQYPAPPDKFVGREKIIEDFQVFVEEIRKDISKFNVSEIVSRSGVGKSSITLKLNSIISESADYGIVVDSRVLRTDIDLLFLFQSVIQGANKKFNLSLEIPSKSNEVSGSMMKLNDYLLTSKKMLIVFLDQFESVFSRVNVYDKMLDIILETTNKESNILYSISRKNDQPTTYDNAYEIDLGRLMQISKKFSLKDFSNSEAELLISEMNIEMRTKLIKSLREQVLEISNGFPWLLKRYCSHIIKLVKKGFSQKQIFESNMQLKDLFEEEIESLDEVLREFFNRLIHYLPATHYELSDVFPEGDLYQKLKILQNDFRLIRLTGKTYDTYNDVLKEYVKTGKVLITSRYIFRMNPMSVIKLFEQIVSKGWNSLDIIQEKTGHKKGAISNKLRELKRVELIEGTSDNFSVVEQAKIAYDEEALNAYLNTILKQNSIVRKIQKLVIGEKRILSDNDVKEILIEEMPFIKASDHTWLSYARNFSNWLKIANIVDYKSKQLRKLGDDYVTTSSNNDYFPSIYMQQLERFIIEVSKYEGAVSTRKISQILGRKSMSGAVTDAKFLDLIEFYGRGICKITDNGRLFVSSSISDRKTYIMLRIENINHIKEYITNVNNGEDRVESFMKIVNEQRLAEWSESTIEWRHKLLKNWLIYGGLIKRSRKKRELKS